MTVWAEVAEADVNKIKLGTPVYFTTLGMPNRKWTGTVRQIQPTPVTTNDVVLYNVLVDADNKDGLLLPDMTVQAFFVLGEAKQVPIAPVAGLEQTKGARNTYTATVLNISVGGMLVDCTFKLTIGDDLDVSFQLPSSDVTIRGTARVMRQAGRNLFGVEFYGLEGEGRDLIAAFVGSEGSD